MNKETSNLLNKKRKEREKYEVEMTDEEIIKFVNDSQEKLVKQIEMKYKQ